MAAELYPCLYVAMSCAAMAEAVKCGKDVIIDVLLLWKASLGLEPIMAAANMCNCK